MRYEMDVCYISLEKNYAGLKKIIFTVREWRRQLSVGYSGGLRNKCQCEILESRFT